MLCFQKSLIEFCQFLQKSQCEVIDLNPVHNFDLNRARLTRHPNGFHITLEDDEGSPSRFEILEPVDVKSKQASSTSELVDQDDNNVNDNVMAIFLFTYKHVFASLKQPTMTYAVLF